MFAKLTSLFVLNIYLSGAVGKKLSSDYFRLLFFVKAVYDQSRRKWWKVIYSIKHFLLQFLAHIFKTHWFSCTPEFAAPDRFKARCMLKSVNNFFSGQYLFIINTKVHVNFIVPRLVRFWQSSIRLNLTLQSLF